MSTLVVQLPPRDPTLSPEEWHLHEMPFALLNQRNEILRVGLGEISEMPRATTAILIVAARDTLMLRLNVPPVKGARLLQALPNVIEDALIQDVHTCHLAVDRPNGGDGRRTVAALDRTWFGFLLNAFTNAGYEKIKAVPIVRCLPPPNLARTQSTDASSDLTASQVQEPAQHAVALLYREPSTAATTPDAKTKVSLELVIAHGATGEGMALRLDSLAATLQALSAAGTLELYRLSDVPAVHPSHIDSLTEASFPAENYAFEQLVRAAFRSDFDLCQFEFSSQTLGRGSIKRWRLSTALAVITLLTTLAAINLEWFIAARQHTALAAQQRALLADTFPDVRVILDPPAQMTQQLRALRVRAGEVGADDFLSLSSNLARALPPIAPEAIVQLGYKERDLQVTFSPDTHVDGSFIERLRSNGLTAHADGNTWLIGSRP